MKRFPEPRKWSISEIEADTEIARGLYAQRRPAEGRDAYRTSVAEARTEVQELLRASDDLLDFATVLQTRRSLLDAARYLDAPPISAADLATVAVCWLRKSEASTSTGSTTSRRLRRFSIRSANRCWRSIAV